MLTFKPAAKTMLVASFLLLFVLINYWIINHCGPVGEISKFTISRYGYWSPALSVGLTVVPGFLLFLGIWAVLLINGQIVYRDQNGTAKKIDAGTLKELARILNEKMRMFKYALVFIVVGAELMAFDIIQNMDLLKMNGVPAPCGVASIQDGSCPSRYVALALDEPPEKRTYTSVEKSGWHYNYYRPPGVTRVFLIEKTYREDQPRFLGLNEVKGVVEKISPADELLIRSEYGDAQGEILVIDPELDPNNISWLMTVIAGIMTFIGAVLFCRKIKVIKQ